MGQSPKAFVAKVRSRRLATADARSALDTFLREAVPLLATLSEAAEAGDADTFARAAQTLALVSAGVDATALAEGARLGVACAATRPGRIGEVLVQIEALCGTARLQAAALLSELR